MFMLLLFSLFSLFYNILICFPVLKNVINLMSLYSLLLNKFEVIGIGNFKMFT